MSDPNRLRDVYIPGSKWIGRWFIFNRPCTTFFFVSLVEQFKRSERNIFKKKKRMCGVQRADLQRIGTLYKWRRKLRLTIEKGGCSFKVRDSLHIRFENVITIKKLRTDCNPWRRPRRRVLGCQTSFWKEDAGRKMYLFFILPPTIVRKRSMAPARRQESIREAWLCVYAHTYSRHASYTSSFSPASRPAGSRWV